MIRKKLLGLGAVLMLREGRFNTLAAEGLFGSGRLEERTGGALFDALAFAASQNIDVTIMSVRGGDAAGERVALAIEKAGLFDHSVVFLDRTTPNATELFDAEGRPVAALSDTALFDLALPKQLRRSRARDAVVYADAVLFDTSLPPAAMEKLAGLAATTPLYGLALTTGAAARLKSVADRLDCVFLDEDGAREFAELAADASAAELASALADKGFKRGMIFGKGWMLGFEHGAAFEAGTPEDSAFAELDRAKIAGAILTRLIGGDTLLAAFQTAAG
ncbi:hypothetical protein QBK99_15580 [Corticibacterium sp. UT-5YL-CI-8]|nr:hypothetical protein [Tianweitania sp. UT-5YL-CI-8]